VEAHNRDAGQGPVLLDIGGTVGAVVVVVPAALSAAEIEARPAGGGAPVHVGVVPRPLPSGRVLHSAVFPGLPAGLYDLYVRPDGPIRLRVTVTGGQVTESVWPPA
jgi:hypothetical protein